MTFHHDSWSSSISLSLVAEWNINKHCYEVALKISKESKHRRSLRSIRSNACLIRSSLCSPRKDANISWKRCISSIDQHKDDEWRLISNGQKPSDLCFIFWSGQIESDAQIVWYRNELCLTVIRCGRICCCCLHHSWQPPVVRLFRNQFPVQSDRKITTKNKAFACWNSSNHQSI